jgi:Rieske Fe-S protein
MKRSEFLKSGGALVVCACGSSMIHGCKAITGNSDTPPVPENAYEMTEGGLMMDIQKIPELTSVGGSVKLELADRELKIIVAKTGENTFVALRDQCTHGGRELEFNPDQSVFRCVSFGHSKFDQEGIVVKGPAKANLDVFETTLIENELQIDLT